MSKIAIIVVGITAAMASLILGPGTASAGYRAYVANGAAAGEVKIFDLDTGTTIGSTLTFRESSVGVQSMALTSDAATLYTADSGDSLAIPPVESRISFASSTGTTFSDSPLSSGLTQFLAVAADPGGSHLWVGLANGNLERRALPGFSNTNVSIGAPVKSIAPNAAGTKVYVGVESGTNIFEVDVSTMTKTAITVGSSPYSVALNPAGTKLYAAGRAPSGTLHVVDTATRGVTPITLTSCSNPQGIAVSPDGSKVYVPCWGSNKVIIVSTATDTETGTISATGTYSTALTGAGYAAFSPDGTKALIGSLTQGMISTVDVATNTVVDRDTLWVGQAPSAIVFAPDQAPSASFTSTAAAAGASTTFDASASTTPIGTIQSYAWDFGDGTTATTSSPTTAHTYTAAGSYTVTLTVTNSQGTSIATSTRYAGSASSSGGAFTNVGAASARQQSTVVITAAASAAPASAAAETATATTKTYPKIKITWKLKSRKLIGTFKAVTNATSYTLVGTGATKKSGTCKASGTGAKRKVTCTLTLKKGATTITVTAKSKTRTILARTVTTKKAA
jgi:YVTN family beta-propeller protein